MRTICIAGKNSIAVNAMKYLLEQNLRNKIVFLPNSTDNGVDSWQPSFKRYAKKMKIEEVSIEDLYELDKLCFISLEYSEIILPSRFKTTQLYNIHFSKLPKYKGMFTSAMPLLNGEFETGVTLHKIDAGIDTGNIIDQINIAIEIDDDCRSLYQKYLSCAYILFLKNINSILANNVVDYSQPNIGASYYSKTSIDYNSLVYDMRKTAYEIHNQFRAFTFREYQMPIFNSWQILRTEITNIKSKKRPGSIVIENGCFFQLSTIDYDILLYKDYYPILWKAAECGDIDGLKSAISHISDIDLKNENGWSALIIASYYGHIEIMKELISCGANLNGTNYKGTSVLMYAFSNYEKTMNPSVIYYLLMNGADPTLKDQNDKDVVTYMNERNCTDLLDAIKSYITAGI